MNILCGGLAQALHNHSQSLGCIIMRGDGTAHECPARVRAHIRALQDPSGRRRAGPGLKLICALGQRDFHLGLRAIIPGAVDRVARASARMHARTSLGLSLSNYTGTRHVTHSTTTSNAGGANQGLLLYMGFFTGSRRGETSPRDDVVLSGDIPDAHQEVLRLCVRYLRKGWNLSLSAVNAAFLKLRFFLSDLTNKEEI